MTGAHCLVCHATAEIVLEMSPARVAEIVRAFTAAHAHGPVVVSTPGPARVTPRVWPGKCAWCGRKGATKRDEDGDRACAKCEAAK